MMVTDIVESMIVKLIPGGLVKIFIVLGQWGDKA